MSEFRLHKHGGLVIALSLACGCATAARPPAVEPPPTVAVEDCFSASDIKARELCFSRMPDEEIDECERMRFLACEPYRDMYRLDQELAALQREALASVRKRFASYVDGDPAYLDDLADYLGKSAQAWSVFRDADCLLEPLAQGMSRREAENLTESCRAERTQARIGQLRGLFFPKET
ncbi:lysozyme inhibitor LprI family protein [Lysobacter sp. BMK333-48F3]|uniref:lysozyme inhibitor LprI family protein n=1 Tax=Lysobacter sp. BMK333-48F3 TaxID=2867962 RepID=UPI001C8BBB84|nr:lysozyme inhibitor LprI family protein [Lysobacter sp. BMK333-48F3]MBX9401499.1 lysozyme inhibitor LprI family protein [Lysobacter sp. BMK333-48F3]